MKYFLGRPNCGGSDVAAAAEWSTMHYAREKNLNTRGIIFHEGENIQGTDSDNSRGQNGICLIL